MHVAEWLPHPGFKDRFSPLAFRYEHHTLFLVLHDEHDTSKCLLIFPSPLAFRYTDETHVHSYSQEFPFMSNIAKDSAYLDWFREVSGCEALDENVVHYALFSWDDCYEIITMTPPQLIWESREPKPLDNQIRPPWAKTL